MENGIVLFTCIFKQALARLQRCAGLSEPLLVGYAININQNLSLDASPSSAEFEVSFKSIQNLKLSGIP